MSAKQATTTMATFTDPESNKNYVLLSIGDPRSRIKKDGTYEGIPALTEDGTPTPLPMDRIKYIGGYKDEGESIEEAGYRELTEEAGIAVAEMAKQAQSINPAYTMKRSSEWSDAEELTLTYIHAHLGEKTVAEVKEALAPGDDSFGIAIVEADKIKQKDGQYVIEAGFTDYKLADTFAPIDYSDWVQYTGEASRAAFDYYNEHSPANPALGLDLDTIGAKDISMYTPTKEDHSLQCEKDASVPAGAKYGSTGGVAPDGAIFTDLVRPQLALQKLGAPARTGFGHDGV